jgi:predicted membrane channel-forming protein YqfA (hemolysin III family)
MAALIGIMVSRLQLSRRLDLDDSTRFFSIFLFICGFIYILIIDKSINSILDALFMMLYMVSLVYILSTRYHSKKKKRKTDLWFWRVE